MLRHLSPVLSLPRTLSCRGLVHFPVAFRRPLPLSRDLDWFDSVFDRMALRVDPFFSSPFSHRLSSLDLPNPIVVEGGIHKFKIEFNVDKFLPEEVEAKHEDDTTKYEFSRVLTVPKGTDISQLKCRYTNGTLTLEAPFEPPVEEKKELPKDAEIKVDHK